MQKTDPFFPRRAVFYTYSDVSLDGLRRWSIQNPSVQNHESTSVTTLGGAGIRTELITRPDGTTQTTGSVNGLVRTVTNRGADGAILYHLDLTYDLLNRPLTKTDSRTGTSTSYYINVATDVLSRTVDHLSRETLFTYDHLGRAKTTDLPDTPNESGGIIANISQTFYFPDGSVREQIGDGGYRTTQSYDYAGRISTMTTYGTETAITRWNYDPARGFLLGKRYNSPTAGSGKGPSYTYTAAGRLKTRTQARLVAGNPLVTTYTYGTANGSSVGYVDHVSHSDGTPAFTVHTRDRLGRSLSLLDQVAGTRTFKYTRHGGVEEESITSGILNGQKLGQGFDSFLRPRTHIATFGTQTLGETTYRYGLSGAIASVHGNGYTAGYFYHPQKRTLDTVTYTKDGDTTPLMQSIRKYDSGNRLTRITAHVNDGGIQKPIDHHAYDYDTLDRIEKHTDIGGALWKYGYNSTGEVTLATRKMADGTTNLNGRDYHYDYDGIGNRTSVEQSREGSTSPRVYSYIPNALNQYSNQTHPGFMDVSGTTNPLAAVTVNGIAATRQSDYFYKELTKDNSTGPQWIDATITDEATTTNGSLPLPAAITNPVHDDDGNLTSDNLWNYRWDAENRLIRCERSATLVSAGAPYLKLEYDYDFQGRRIRSSNYTSSGATTPATQTLFIFDGWKCIAELDVLSSNQIVRKYTWGLDLAGDMGDSSTGNVGALLWLVDTATNTNHVHLYGSTGNVSGLVDVTTRKRSATYDYDAFGQLTVCYGEYAKKNQFTFSTKHTDFTTGLCYYGYRWYSPMHGRWLGRDPAQEQGGVNLYGMTGNDSVNLIDILGEGPPKLIPDWHHLIPDDMIPVLRDIGIIVKRNTAEWGRIMPDGHYFDATHIAWFQYVRDFTGTTEEEFRKHLDDGMQSKEFRTWYEGSVQADVSHWKWRRKTSIAQKLAKAGKVAGPAGAIVGVVISGASAQDMYNKYRRAGHTPAQATAMAGISLALPIDIFEEVYKEYENEPLMQICSMISPSGSKYVVNVVDVLHMNRLMERGWKVCNCD